MSTRTMLAETDRPPSKDLELGRAEFENPVADNDAPSPRIAAFAAFENEADGGAAESFEAEVIGTNATDKDLQRTEDMLQELMFAFDSADVDGNGVLDAEELLAMIRVLGGSQCAQTIGPETMKALIAKEWEELERRETSASIADKNLDDLIKAAVKRKAAGAMATGALKKGVQGVKAAGAMAASVTRSSVRKPEDQTISAHELDYPMFVYLIMSGRAGAFLPEDYENWRDHVRKLRLLKYVWNTADVDGDGELTMQEMRDVASTLLGHMSPDEFASFWDLVSPAEDTTGLTYLDYLNGMALAELHPVFGAKLEFLTPSQLMTVSLDVPVDRKEEKMMLASLSRAERFGVNILRRKERRAAENRASKDFDQPDGKSAAENANDAALYARLTEGTVHLFSDHQRRKLRKNHRHMVFYGCLFGFLSSLCTALSENVATYLFDTNGIENPDTGEPSSHEQKKNFAIVIGSALLVCSAIEISLLYLYALRHVMQTAHAAGLRLTPLNRDRTHIAQFLVQAALEMAHHNNVVHGVDPLKDSRDHGKWLVILFVVVYKAKIALTSFLLKIALKRLVSRDAAKYAVPYMAVPATMLWNALISHGVMKQAELRSIGIATAVELFDAILNNSTGQCADKDTEELSALFKVQLLRSIAMVIVKRKDLYPTQEVLLKHAVHTLRMSAAVDNTIGYVDSEHDYLKHMGELTSKQQGQCLQVFVLATILDGEFSRRDKQLYHKLCASADEQFEPHATYIQHCAQRLRKSQTVTAVDIRHCVYWEPEDGAHELTRGYYVSECLHTLFGICAC